MSVPPKRSRRRPESPGAQAWQLLWELTKASRPHVEAVAADFGLTATQAWALKLLVSQAWSMSELALEMSCDASSVTAIVDRLESHGFVERKASERDRRVKVLVVTPAGRLAQARLAARMEQAPPAIANLSASDQRALRDVLRRALDSLDSLEHAEALAPR